MCESEAGFLRVHNILIMRLPYANHTPKNGNEKDVLKIVFGGTQRNVSAGGLWDLNAKKLLYMDKCLDTVVRKVMGSSFSAIKKNCSKKR